MFNFNKIKKAAADLISIIVSVVIIAALVLGILLFLSNKVRSTAMDEINNTMNTITGIAEANRNNTDIIVPGGPGGGEIPEGPQTPVTSPIKFGQRYMYMSDWEGLIVYTFFEDGSNITRVGDNSNTYPAGTFIYDGNELFYKDGDYTELVGVVSNDGETIESYGDTFYVEKDSPLKLNEPYNRYTYSNRVSDEFIVTSEHIENEDYIIIGGKYLYSNDGELVAEISDDGNYIFRYSWAVYTHESVFNPDDIKWGLTYTSVDNNTGKKSHILFRPDGAYMFIESTDSYGFVLDENPEFFEKGSFAFNGNKVLIKNQNGEYEDWGEVSGPDGNIIYLKDGRMFGILV